MAAISTTGSGNWSSTTPNAPWPSGVLPTSVDTVTIASGHTVTQESMTAVASSVTIASGGILKASRSASSQLSVGTTITRNAGGVLDYGKTSDRIPAGVVATLVLQVNANSAGQMGLLANGGSASSGLYLCGENSRMRVTVSSGAVTAGAVSMTVADATGWQVGDEIQVLHADLTGAGSYQTERRTLTSVAGNVIGFSALTYAHAAGCGVDNLTCNVILKSFNNNFPAKSQVLWDVNDAINSVEIDNVRFNDMGFSTNIGALEFFPSSNAAGAGKKVVRGVDDCVFWKDSTATVFGGTQIYTSNAKQRIAVRNCAFALRSIGSGSDSAFSLAILLDIENCHVSAASFLVSPSGYAGIGMKVTGGIIAIQGNIGIDTSTTGGEFFGTKFCGYGLALTYSSTHNLKFYGCDFGDSLGFKDQYGDGLLRGAGSSIGGSAKLYFEDCLFSANMDIKAGLKTDIVNAVAGAEIVFANKNLDPLVQELWTESAVISRDTAFSKDVSGSSLKVLPHAGALGSSQFPLTVYAPSNQPIVVSGYVYQNAAFNGAVTVTLSGLGITPNIWTADPALDDQWQQFAVFGTNTSADGMLTVTFEVSGTAGAVWVDGVSAPTPIAVNSGEFGFWAKGLPVPVVSANFVAAQDVWNVQGNQLTLAGSVGKLVADGLAAGVPTAPDIATAVWNKTLP